MKRAFSPASIEVTHLGKDVLTALCAPCKRMFREGNILFALDTSSTSGVRRKERSPALAYRVLGRRLEFSSGLSETMQSVTLYTLSGAVVDGGFPIKRDNGRTYLDLK